jgi:hypothetical protein
VGKLPIGEENGGDGQHIFPDNFVGGSIEIVRIEVSVQLAKLSAAFTGPEGDLVPLGASRKNHRVSIIGSINKITT